MVLSCWSIYFSRPDRDTLRYTDRLTRWSRNEAGNRALRTHLLGSFQGAKPVRLVIATASNRGVVDAGLDASTTSKTFHIRPDLVGKIVRFDGDEFVIDFARKPL